MPAPDGPFAIAVRVYGPEPSVPDGGRVIPTLAVRTTELAVHDL
ncbi:hypothetical protein [Streptomyces sp. BE230]|nr:hypothetical protein [Streptomyces sp. BE230]